MVEFDAHLVYSAYSALLRVNTDPISLAFPHPLPGPPPLYSCYTKQPAIAPCGLQLFLSEGSEVLIMSIPE
jgi:hypothetical protein